ncbi:hypothetical protein B9Z55_027601 [Caenorhabditis nigoni]|nr:hypothetical protein B9Z55_027601 [Caenorhabditis nigoni]
MQKSTTKTTKEIYSNGALGDGRGVCVATSRRRRERMNPRSWETTKKMKMKKSSIHGNPGNEKINSEKKGNTYTRRIRTHSQQTEEKWSRPPNYNRRHHIQHRRSKKEKYQRDRHRETSTQTDRRKEVSRLRAFLEKGNPKGNEKKKEENVMENSKMIERKHVNK